MIWNPGPSYAFVNNDISVESDGLITIMSDESGDNIDRLPKGDPSDLPSSIRNDTPIPYCSLSETQTSSKNTSAKLAVSLKFFPAFMFSILVYILLV